MANITTCDPCLAYGLPGEDIPGTVTRATTKSPVILRKWDEKSSGWVYTIKEADVCATHDETFTGLHLRIALALPEVNDDPDFVTGWEPQAEMDLTEAAREELELDELDDGGVDPASLGMDEEDAEALREHLNGSAPTEPEEVPLTASQKLRAGMVAKQLAAAPIVAKAATKSTPRKGLKALKESGSAIREWAKASGIAVADRGAIPQSVLTAFLESDPSHAKFFENA
jgi:hypothetical protein